MSEDVAPLIRNSSELLEKMFGYQETLAKVIERLEAGLSKTPVKQPEEKKMHQEPSFQASDISNHPQFANFNPYEVVMAANQDLFATQIQDNAAFNFNFDNFQPEQDKDKSFDQRQFNQRDSDIYKMSRDTH